MANYSDPFTKEIEDDPTENHDFWKDYKRPDQLNNAEIVSWGDIIERKKIENAVILARRLRKNMEYKMNNEMADRLVQYAIRCAESIGYDEDQIKTDLPDCFMSLGSPHHVIKEIVDEEGKITLSFEENFLRQNLITNEWEDVNRVIDEQPVTYEGIRKIVITAFKHISELNLYSAVEEVMDEESNTSDTHEEDIEEIEQDKHYEELYD